MLLAHIHPALVHFPIVLVLLLLLSDLVIVVRRESNPRAAWPSASAILGGLATLAAILTYVFGDIAYDIALENGLPEADLETHEGWGTITAIVIAVLGLVRVVLWLRNRAHGPRVRPLLLVASAAASALVIVTAYFGGDLVYHLGVNVEAVIR